MVTALLPVASGHAVFGSLPSGHLGRCLVPFDHWSLRMGSPSQLDWFSKLVISPFWAGCTLNSSGFAVAISDALIRPWFGASLMGQTWPYGILRKLLGVCLLHSGFSRSCVPQSRMLASSFGLV